MAVGAFIHGTAKEDLECKMAHHLRLEVLHRNLLCAAAAALIEALRRYVAAPAAPSVKEEGKVSLRTVASLCQVTLTPSSASFHQWQLLGSHRTDCLSTMRVHETCMSCRWQDSKTSQG